MLWIMKELVSAVSISMSVYLRSYILTWRRAKQTINYALHGALVSVGQAEHPYRPSEQGEGGGCVSDRYINKYRHRSLGTLVNKADSTALKSVAYRCTFPD